MRLPSSQSRRSCMITMIVAIYLLCTLACTHVHAIICNGDTYATTVTQLSSLSQCSSINGNLTIDGGITSSQCQLTNLTSITGSLQILAPSQLTNVDCFRNLTMVGKGIFIWGKSINSLAGFSNLQNVSIVHLEGLDALTSSCLYGLHNVRSPVADVFINSLGDYRCTNWFGFMQYVPYVTGRILSRDTYLVTIDAFYALIWAGSIQIENNELKDMAGFANLRNVTGTVSISSEKARSLNFSGFGASLIGGDLEIYSNGLTAIRMPNLRRVNGYVTIVYNAYLSSVKGLSSLAYIGIDLQYYSNGLSQTPQLNQSFVGFEGLQQIVGQLYLSEEAVTNFVGFNSLARIGSLYLDNWNAPGASFKGLDALQYIGTEFHIENCDTLTNFTGLGNLRSIDGYFTIIWSDALINGAGMGSLQSIGRYLQIQANDLWTDMTGFESLQSVGSDIAIQSNPALVSFKGWSPLFTNATGDFLIVYNTLLVNVDALYALRYVGGNFAFLAQPYVTSLLGLRNLTYVGETFTFRENHGITSLGSQSLLSLAYVGRTFQILQCGALVTVNVPSLLFVNDTELQVCPALTYIQLPNLSTYSVVISTMASLLGIHACNGPIGIMVALILTTLPQLRFLYGFNGPLYLGYLEFSNIQRTEEFIGFNNMVYPGTDQLYWDNWWDEANQRGNWDRLTVVDGFNAVQSLYYVGTWNTTRLKRWNGFNGLTTVSKMLYFQVLPSLSGATGFASLQHCQELYLAQIQFTNISFASSISSIHMLTIQLLPNLQNIDALSNVRSITGQILMNYNDAITDLYGLRFAKGTLTDTLQVLSNDKLRNLDGLINIKGALGGAYVRYNEDMVSIAGLCNFKYAGEWEIGGSSMCCDSVTEITNGTNGIGGIAWNHSWVPVGVHDIYYCRSSGCAGSTYYGCTCSSFTPELCDPPEYACNTVGSGGYNCIPIACSVLQGDGILNVNTTNSNNYPSTATYTCANGYQLVGSSLRNCTRTASWTLTAPVCQDINECTASTISPCDARSECTNYDGGYQCTPYPLVGTLRIVTGQLNASNIIWSYLSNITQATNTTLNGPLVDSISGGQYVEFDYSKGNGTITGVTYSMLGSSTVYACTNIGLTSVSPVTGRLQCRLSAGIGRALSFTLQYCGTGVISTTCGSSRIVAPYDILSYPPPAIIPATLRLAGTAVTAGTTILQLAATSSISISFNILNLQPTTDQTVLRVTYGPVSNRGRYGCTVQDSQSSATVVTCLTESDADGSDYFQLVQTGWTTVGTDMMVYPAASSPVITAVRGCVDDMDGSNSTSQCPTAGGLSVFVYGTYLTGSLRILVNGIECKLINTFTGGAECTLPRGAGALQPVVAVANSIFGSPSRLVNYAAPVITQLVGCDHTDINDTATLALTNCARAGNAPLTLVGTNFGGSGASVLIGTSQCTSVVHDTHLPDEIITCTLPSGTRTAQSVIVIQQNGDLSKTSSAIISFVQCAPGYYETGAVACAICDVGTYTVADSQTRCDRCPSGSYANATATSVCASCQSGRYQPVTGAKNCTRVAAGQYSTAGAIVASECSSGTYSAFSGLSTCDVCDGGTKQLASGKSFCESCDAGTYSISVAGGITSCDICGAGKWSATGSTACTSCAAGKYGPDASRSYCMDCAAGTRSNEGAVVCVSCDDGFYAVNSSCVACPANSKSDSTNTGCLCNRLYYGAYTSSGLLVCSICPTGANCNDAGTMWNTITIEAGYWRSDNSSLTFYKCVSTNYCPGGATSCAPFRTGPLCSNCVQNYVPSTLDGTCTACPSNSQSAGMSVLVIIIVIAALCLLYYSVLKTPTNSNTGNTGNSSNLKGNLGPTPSASPIRFVPLVWVDGQTVPMDDRMFEVAFGGVTLTRENREPPTLTFNLKSAVGFVQISTRLAAVIQIAWPTYFLAFIKNFELLNLDFIPWQTVGCLTRISFYTKFMVITLVPPILLAIISVLFFIILRWVDRRDLHDSNRGRMARILYRQHYWRIVLFTLFLLYPGMSSKVMSIFVCEEVDGTRWLTADFTLQCGDAEYNRFLGFAIPMVIIYPIGVPLFFFVMLYRYRNQMDTPDVMGRLGFLYKAYNKSVWWFELCDMANKLFLTSLLVFFPSDWQLPAGLVWSACFIMVIFLTSPYVRRTDDRMQLFAQLEVFLLLLAGFVLREIDIDSSFDIGMSVLLIILVVYVICLFLLHLFLFLRYKYKEMMRERLKAEMLAANPDIYARDGIHSRAGSTTSINTGELGGSGGGMGQSSVELLPHVSSDHHGSGALANSSSNDDAISLADTPASVPPTDDAQ